jgi:putative transcriptional regulator
MKKLIIKNNIRKYRFENNEMSQQELADKAGVTRQAILSIEKGAYYPSLELAFKISRVFNAGVEEIFSYEENDK